MDFKLSEQQQELQQTARNFAQKEMTEVAHSIEQTSEPLSKEWLKKYADMVGVKNSKIEGSYNYFCVFLVFGLDFAVLLELKHKMVRLIYVRCH